MSEGMNYRIIYRDGMVGEWTDWRVLLVWLRLARRLPWPLRPVRVDGKRSRAAEALRAQEGER